MDRSLLARLTSSRFDGRVARLVTALVRIVPGFLFISFSTGKFIDHAQESKDFDRYGVPIPEVATYAVGTLELVCGVLLVLGLMTRPAAALLAANMVGAIATAGTVDGGSFHLGVAPAMLVTMLVILWLGPGAPSVDDRLHKTRLEPARHPHNAT